jgi:hypothetical protein
MLAKPVQPAGDERGLLIAHPDILSVLAQDRLNQLARIELALKKLRDTTITVPAIS